MKVLIAEDDNTTRRMVSAVVRKWGYEVVPACDGREAWKILKAPDAPHMAILDWMMPEMDGPELCRRVRGREKSKKEYTFLILLTAKGDTESIITGMECGADDYVTKPYNPQELKCRLGAGKRIIELQLQLLAAEEELKLLSRTDSLTGIFNRRAIFEQIEHEISRVKRENSNLTISALDIDYFKKVNDTYGHSAGDTVLRECAKQITSRLRSYDTFGRIGGEEFLLLFPGVGANEAVGVTERIRSAIESMDIVVNGNHIRITASQGIATWDTNSDIDHFIAIADGALYKAKENGRNRIEHAQQVENKESPLLAVELSE
ncbi:MAG: diguanylate cyclase [Deltaproteobacteria bacterium]|nr:diguanylate cyclase [Deltaproteobacteria bacterium]